MALGERRTHLADVDDLVLDQGRHRHRRRHRLRRPAAARRPGHGRGTSGTYASPGPATSSAAAATSAVSRRSPPDPPWPPRCVRAASRPARRPGRRRPRSGPATATPSPSCAQAGRDIGDVVATMVNLINPSVVVIGGQLAAAGEHLLAGIREVVYQRSLPLATEHLRSSPPKPAGRPASSVQPPWPSSTCSRPRRSRPRASPSPHPETREAPAKGAPRRPPARATGAVDARRASVGEVCVVLGSAGRRCP